MAPWTIDRLGGTAISGAIELFLLVKIWRALSRGTVSVTFGNRTPSDSFLHLKAHRNELPVFYWILLAVLVLGAIVVAAIVAIIAGGFVT
jgi:hypothetical protein